MLHSTTPNKKKGYFLLSSFIWLFVWHLASIVIGKDILLVSPLVVLKTLFLLIKEVAFWTTISFSFTRIVGGFFLALLVGVSLAVLSSQFIFIRFLLNPLTAVISSTPIVSFIILALIWIPTRNLSLFIAFLMVLPIIYTNTLQGILNTDQKLLEMAEVFRIPLYRKIIYIYLPQVMPFFVSACSVGLGLCWKSGIAAEVIGLPTHSIGERLYEAKIYLSTSELFAWTFVIILISILFEKLFIYFLKKISERILAK
ncbi:nitrate ABC transporter permease [Sporanaerobium hydrogeniformans]|uniref:Nitrate ABC transporter permease n=1 Tax=Sporanaerobium hydrogeniformans TaxID=3072179 RepID=A0AC61DC47_9FIRM|nr:ABC transporter permease subunit [Sporanaerobium hydrogeniformans]PHV70859.1 nitrate ABC transporter permease [Sporanaerobium hydrogeniformans]